MLSAHNAAMTTIFDKILDGELPCHEVYRDDHVLAFLDISPLAPGHTLVIPQQRVAHLHELTDESGAALGRALPRIAKAVMSVTSCDHYNILQNNGSRAHQMVMHVHFHIIPKPDMTRGLSVGWPARSLDNESAAQMAAQIRTTIG